MFLGHPGKLLLLQVSEYFGRKPPGEEDVQGRKSNGIQGITLNRKANEHAHHTHLQQYKKQLIRRCSGRNKGIHNAVKYGIEDLIHSKGDTGSSNAPSPEAPEISLGASTPEAAVLNSKFPERSAVPPSKLPLMNTLAPGSGSPFLSVIFPLMSVCPRAVRAQANKRSSSEKVIFVSMILFVLIQRFLKKGVNKIESYRTVGSAG
jgi:hypothetical protein